MGTKTGLTIVERATVAVPGFEAVTKNKLPCGDKVKAPSKITLGVLPYSPCRSPGGYTQVSLKALLR